jgi:hypothetical protein
MVRRREAVMDLTPLDLRSAMATRNHRSRSLEKRRVITSKRWVSFSHLSSLTSPPLDGVAKHGLDWEDDGAWFSCTDTREEWDQLPFKACNCSGNTGSSLWMTDLQWSFSIAFIFRQCVSHVDCLLLSCRIWICVDWAMLCTWRIQLSSLHRIYGFIASPFAR